MKFKSVPPCAVLGSLLASALLGACKPAQTDNPDVAQGYRENNKYEGEIVTGSYRSDYSDQGKGIKPATLRAIEDTINTSYQKDFERCLEDEMAAADTRFMRSKFSVEFRIDTAGKAGNARILNIWLRKQNAKGADLGEVPADNLSSCIAAAISEWVFDPAPEVDYVHTYQGQLGEAF